MQLQGQLKVEFERDELADSILEPGDLIVLPSVLSYTNHIYDRMRTSSMALGNTHGGCTSDHTYTGTKETT